MMKFFILTVVVFLAMGCSSTAKDKQEFMEGAQACNTMCKNNRDISEYSIKAGGGMPLLFIGGMEVKCACSNRR